MITILHGDDTTASREHFLELAKSQRVLDGTTLMLTDLVQFFEGEGMFDNDQTLFVENFLSRKGTGKAFEEIIAYLNKNSAFVVVLWEGRSLTKTKLSLLKNPQIKEYKFPQYLFTFLDNIKPNNTKETLTLFHQCLDAQEPEMLLFMIERQFRLLLGIVSSSNIDEVKRLVPWKKGKLEKQAGLFLKDKLIQLYKRLFDIDLASKTGNLHTTLSQAIDFFLLEI